MSILKLKDSQGNWVGVPTLKGDKGNGISSAVLNNDYTLTLTFTDGTTYTTPSIRGEKGEQGEPATDMDIHICSSNEYDSETRIPTIANPDDKTFYLVPTVDGTSPDLFTEWVYVNNAWEMFGSMKIDLSGYLTDVKVGGNSVVNNGVAEIPIATGASYGVVKTGSQYGTFVDKNTNVISIKSANSNIIKNPDSYWYSIFQPITPELQHESTFYGLAKASGHDEKDSELPVGQYTDEAKSSIQSMLGITDKYSPKEWVAESETELVTNAHSVGDLFYIGETLYKVIADLNAGDAINVGVNVEEVDVNNILTDYATKEDVENNVSIVEKETSGAIITIDDGVENSPLKKMVVDINPVQDLHGYDSPWVAGGHYNILDEEFEEGRFDTTTGANVATSTQLRTKNINKCLPNTQYYFSSPYSAWFIFYDGDGNVVPTPTMPEATTTSGNSVSIHKGTFTTPTGAYGFRIYLNTSYGTTYNHDIAINYPSSVTTYSPYENICPISGWIGANVVRSGKNLFDESAIYHGSYAISPPNYPLNAQNEVYRTVIIDYLPSGTYTFSTSLSSCVILRYLNGSTNVGVSSQQTTFTVTMVKSGKFMLCFRKSDSSAITESFTVQVEQGSTATSYESYNGIALPISWQTEAGTVYGGKLDVLSGVMRITHEKAVVTSFSGVFGQVTKGYAVYTTVGKYTHVVPSYEHRAMKSNMFTYSRISRGNMPLFSYGGNDGADVTQTYILPSTITSLAEANAWLSALETPLECTFYLATPIEIQLDAHTINSLLGTNNIWADTGDTSVEYFSQVDKDLIDYIETSLKPYVKKERLNDYVDDIQIDGTSIVENGIAEIPFATSNTGGVVKVDSSLGIKLNDTNKLLINRATTTQAKAGSDAARPIVPICQHESVFYGLTKAAGVDMASSSNAVGTYTESAKSAISDMLNGAIQISGTDPTITAKSGIRYVCGEVLSLNFTPSANGICDVMFTSGSTPTVLTLPNTVKMPEWFTIEANTTYEINIADGIYGAVTSWTL